MTTYEQKANEDTFKKPPSVFSEDDCSKSTNLNSLNKISSFPASISTSSNSIAKNNPYFLFLKYIIVNNPSWKS